MADEQQFFSARAFPEPQDVVVPGTETAATAALIPDTIFGFDRMYVMIGLVIVVVIGIWWWRRRGNRASSTGRSSKAVRFARYAAARRAGRAGSAAPSLGARVAPQVVSNFALSGVDDELIDSGNFGTLNFGRAGQPSVAPVVDDELLAAGQFDSVNQMIGGGRSGSSGNGDGQVSRSNPGYVSSGLQSQISVQPVGSITGSNLMADLAVTAIPNKNKTRQVVRGEPAVVGSGVSAAVQQSPLIDFVRAPSNGASMGLSGQF